jgi:drug/metabolite transporter (DMT)-like permease
MIAGIVLVVAGILIAVYPPLLSLIVATVLILLGVLLLTAAYYDRKLSRHYENPVIELFFRL